MTARRRLLQAAAGAVAASALPGGLRRAQAQPRPRTWVLVHGAWHGGWCWQRIVPQLTAAGHRVLTPTLAGLGDQAHRLSRAVDLDTHINDVVELMTRQDLRDVLLVGHSYAGLVVTGAADRAAERVGHLIYFDAVIVANGEAWSATHSPERMAAWTRAGVASGGLSVPPPDASAFGIADAADRKWVNRQLTPHPYGTYTQKLRLARPPGAGLRKTNIVCRGPAALSQASRRVRIDAAGGWSVRTLQASHDAMVTAPAALADLLISIV